MSVIGARDVSGLGSSTWVPHQVGAWSAPGNWIGAVPSTDHDVFVDSGVGTVDLDFDLKTLTFTGGTIDGPGRISIAQSFHWQGGNLEGAGTILINDGATLFATSGINQSTRLFRNIENHGTISWAATASLETGGGVVFANLGVIDFASDSLLGPELGPTPQHLHFINSGTILKSQGVGSTSLQGLFYNTGSIIVHQGTLHILARDIGFSENGSHLHINDGATLTLAGAGVWLKPGTGMSGAGKLENLGRLRADAALLAQSSVMMNGVELAIDGANPDLDTESFAWNRGVLSGPGVTRLSSDLTFTQGWGVTGGRVLDSNNFDLTWIEAPFTNDSVFFTGAGTIENRASSTLRFQGTSTSLQSLGSGEPAPAVINTGTIDLQTAGAFVFPAHVSNSGTIIINTGTFLDSNQTAQGGAGVVALMGGIDTTGAIVGPGGLVLGGPSSAFSGSSRLDVGSLHLVAGTATLSNVTPGAYQAGSLVLIGDATQLDVPSRMVVEPNVLLSAAAIKLVGAGQLDIDGGHIATGSFSLGRPFAGDAPRLRLDNAAQVAADEFTLNDGTLDLQSGTLTAAVRFEVAGGTAELTGMAAISTPDWVLSGGTVHVSPGFIWPASSFVTTGSLVRLLLAVSYSFTGASMVAGGGITLDADAQLDVHSMEHAGVSEIHGTMNVSTTWQEMGQTTIIVPGALTAGSIEAAGVFLLEDGLISAPISLSLTGAMLGSGTINGNLSASGLLAPGDPQAVLSINGDLLLGDTSQVLFPINTGADDAQAGRIEVSGHAQIGGAIQPLFVDEGMLLPNQDLVLIRWSTYAGEFVPLALDTGHAGLHYVLEYASDELRLKAVAQLGDANFDGVTNSLDFNALATWFGATSSVNWTHGDFDGDGAVNSNDFALLAAHFNQIAPLGNTPSDLTTLPEPESLMLLALPMLRRRRRGLANCKGGSEVC